MLSFSLEAFAYSFPDGVDETKAYNSAYKADEVLKNAVSSLGKKNLTDMLYEMLITDETLSQILIGFYKEMEKNSADIKSLNIDITPVSVAHSLSSFPFVEAVLLGCNSWSEVNLDGVSWGVSDKNSFAVAVSAMFAPFNSLLYTLLCSGSYSLGLVSIQGDDGYKNSVMGLLSAFGCTEIVSAEQFKANAAANMYSMVQSIVLSLFSLAESVCSSPVVRLSQILPNLAYYLKEGGLTSAIETLVSPLKVKIMNIIPVLDGSSLLSFVENPEESLGEFINNPTESVNSMLSSYGITVADIDLELIASCGIVENGNVNANIGSASATIIVWFIDTLKLNKESIASVIKGENMGDDAMTLINAVLSLDSSKLYSSLVETVTQTAAVNYAFSWEKPEFSQTNVTYTENLNKEKFQRVLDGIDELVNEFIKESGEKRSLGKILKQEIYSPKIVSEIFVFLYKELSKDDLSSALSVIGIDISPKAVAKYIDLEFYKVKTVLANASSWSQIEKEDLEWDFEKGNSKKFEKAIICTLKPFEKILRMLLLSESINVFGLDIYGSNGYNNSVIPLYEALGCKEDLIMSEQQLAVTTNDGTFGERLVEPIFSLIDEILEKPLYKMCEVLPNMIFFIESGGLQKCIENLILPIETTLSKFGITSETLGINIDSFKNSDILKIISEDAVNLLSDEVTLDVPNLALLGTLGQLQEYQSKSTDSQGAFVSLYKVKAEPCDVVITILRYFVNVLKKEENQSLLDNLFASDESAGGADAMFSQFSSGIGQQLASMSTDETVEWLYKLFFRERAVSNIASEDEYMPTIIYKASKKVNVEVASPIIIVFVIAFVIGIINRDKIMDFVNERKKAKKVS